jgi:hypothetical protein
MLATLILGALFAAELDEGPSGAVVTVRPTEGLGERVILVDANGREIPMPDDVPPLWAINPAAWREAIATVEELFPYRDLAAQHLETLGRCQAELDPTKQTLAMCQGEGLVLETRLADLKKQRWRWLGVGVGSGLVVGAGAVMITSLAVGG